MVKYNEIKSNPALKRLLALTKANWGALCRWDPDGDASKAFLAILEELGETTTREWTIALLEYAHEHRWETPICHIYYDDHAKDVVKLGDEMKKWVDAQIEIRTPSENPKRFVPTIGGEWARLYPKQLRLAREHNSAEHDRLRGLAKTRASAAMVELTPEQERAWLFGRFFPYPGPYAGYSHEIAAFHEAFVAWRDEKCILGLDEFLANLTPEKMGVHGLDREWVLPPPALWTRKMRLAFQQGMTVALTDAHEEPRVSYVLLVNARLKQAIENGEMTESDEEKAE